MLARGKVWRRGIEGSQKLCGGNGGHGGFFKIVFLGKEECFSSFGKDYVE
jgi:hypothetical protein